MPQNPHSIFRRTGETIEARTSMGRALTTSALVLTAALVLTGCASGSAAPQADEQDTSATEQQSGEASGDTQPSNDGGGDSNAPAQGRATVTLTDQSFTFTPSACIIYDDEVVITGPGADDDSGDPAYLDIDVYALGSDTGGEVRITLGTDQPFVTTDDFLVAFLGEPHDYVISAVNNQLQVEGMFLMNGQTQVSTGTVFVDCN